MFQSKQRSAIIEKEIKLRRFLQTPVDSRRDMEKTPRKNIIILENFCRNSFTSKKLKNDWDDRMRRIVTSHDIQRDEIYPHLMASAVLKPPVSVKPASIEEIAISRERRVAEPMYILHTIPQKRRVDRKLRRPLFSRHSIVLY